MLCQLNTAPFTKTTKSQQTRMKTSCDQSGIIWESFCNQFRIIFCNRFGLISLQRVWDHHSATYLGSFFCNQLGIIFLQPVWDHLPATTLGSSFCSQFVIVVLPSIWDHRSATSMASSEGSRPRRCNDAVAASRRCGCRVASMRLPHRVGRCVAPSAAAGYNFLSLFDGTGGPGKGIYNINENCVRDGS